jgi:superfamily I DNA/RNA helicase
VFDTASSEADWVAQTIRQAVENGSRRLSDFAILVRSNREADIFLRALNVLGLPWQFSGASGLFAREETKLLLSCLKTLADPEDSLSWYHVASSTLYRCPMADLARLLASANRTNRSLRTVVQQLDQEEALSASISEQGRGLLQQLLQDVGRLLELSRTHSGGQLQELLVAVDLDGLASGVHHQVAVLAVLEVLFELAGQTRVQLAVQVVAELVDYAFAVQGLILGPSPRFRSSQNFPSRCRPPGPGFS